MKFKIEKSLDDYVAIGNETVAEFLQSDDPVIAAVREFHAFFAKTLWNGDVEVSPNQAFLAMNAYMLYTGAVRISLSGHVAATFPLFRTALEAACYAYLMGEDESLETVWTSRHDSLEAERACRKMFIGAVKDAAAKIGKGGNAESGTEQWINDCYQGAIDFGAHPNPRSVYRHIQEPVDANEHWLISLTGLYDRDSSQAQTNLMACMDYGLVIAVVLLHAQRTSESTSTAAAELSRLNQLKNDIEERYFVRRSVNGAF